MALDQSTVVLRGSQANEGMTREEIAAMFARRHLAHENLDAAALAADYTDDCRVESPTAAGVIEGRAAVEKVFRAVFEAFPDLKMRQEMLIVDGDRVAQLVIAEGTDMGGFMGLPPHHKAFRIPVAFLYEFRGRQIAWERRVYDFTGLLVQIGVLKAKPV